MIQRVKGTQDFLDLRLFNFIINQTRQFLATANFTEVSTPIIEHTELFIRSVGEHTDIVHKEMYVIKTRDEDESMCLRPEGTAAIARAFVENGIQSTPWKVFTWGPFFRYERPQKGRFRQFHQVSMEIIGASSIAHDALFIKQLDTLFTNVFKLEQYALAINFLGTREDRAAHRTALETFVSKHQESICKTCQQRSQSNLLRIFDCKESSCQELYQQAPVLTDYLSESSQAEWQELQRLLRLLSVSFTVQPRLVRGLDYYNKTVFEFVSTQLGAQSTFCGGGRYDNLIQTIGAKNDEPSIGAAFGVERLMMLLEQQTDTLLLPQEPSLTVIIPFEAAQNATALLVADSLQQNGISCEVLCDEGSLKAKMRKANKLAAAYTILIGSEEQQSGMAQVKNMITGGEQHIKFVDLPRAIKHHEIK